VRCVEKIIANDTSTVVQKEMLVNSLGGFARVLGSMVAVVLGGVVLVAAVMSVGISSIPASAQSSSCATRPRSET
jgi:hypothetical protein